MSLLTRAERPPRLPPLQPSHRHNADEIRVSRTSLPSHVSSHAVTLPVAAVTCDGRGCGVTARVTARQHIGCMSDGLCDGVTATAGETIGPRAPRRYAAALWPDSVTASGSGVRSITGPRAARAWAFAMSTARWSAFVFTATDTATEGVLGGGGQTRENTSRHAPSATCSSVEWTSSRRRFAASGVMSSSSRTTRRCARDSPPALGLCPFNHCPLGFRPDMPLSRSVTDCCRRPKTPLGQHFSRLGLWRRKSGR